VSPRYRWISFSGLAKRQEKRWVGRRLPRLSHSALDLAAASEFEAGRCLILRAFKMATWLRTTGWGLYGPESQNSGGRPRMKRHQNAWHNLPALARKPSKREGHESYTRKSLLAWLAQAGLWGRMQFSSAQGLTLSPRARLFRLCLRQSFALYRQ